MPAELTVLVASPCWANFPIVPHALLDLAASLRQAGIPVSIVDPKLPPYTVFSGKRMQRVLEEIVPEVARRSPAWVGLPCYTTDYWHIRELAGRIKESTGARIVVGGPHPTLRPEEFFYPGSPFDAVVIGEGDETLVELVTADAAGRPWEEIRGIAFRSGDRLVRTPSRPPVEDLGTLPRPAYDLLDMEHYLRPTGATIRTLVVSGVQVYTSRGCPFRCTFCAARMIQEAQGLPPAIRHRPVGQIIDTLRWLRETFRMESFYLADDTFAVPPARAVEFCRQYRASGLGMPWAAQTRVNLLDDSLARELVGAGCVQLDFGIESGSDAALARMKKGITVADTRRAVALCRRHRMRVFANIMFNTPGETEEDVRLTLALMRQMRADHTSVLLTVPLPGAGIYEERFGPGGLSPEEYRIFSRPGLYNRIVDPRFRLADHHLDLGRLYILVNLRYYLRNNLRFLSLRGWYRRMFLASRRKGAYAAAYAAALFRLPWRSLVKISGLLVRRREPPS